MIILISIVISILFGVGVFLLLKRDLIRVLAGIIMISNSINLFIISAGLSRGAAPIYPIPTGRGISDPVVQALVLTAVVISFAGTLLLFSLLFRVYSSSTILDQEGLRQAVEEEVEDIVREETPAEVEE